MEIQVIFFGSLTDTTLENQLLVKDCVDTDGLINQLNQRYPLLRVKKYFIAVNKKMIHANTLLSSGDIVALMPPFSGG